MIHFFWRWRMTTEYVGLGELIEYQGFLIESHKFDTFSMLFDVNYEPEYEPEPSCAATAATSTNYEEPEEDESRSGAASAADDDGTK